MDISCLFGDLYTYIFTNTDEPSSIQIIFKALIITSSFVGFIGNFLICYVILWNKHMHTTTNYYLFSLAVSDGTQAVSLICSTMYRELTRYLRSDLLEAFIVNTAVYIITSCSSIALALAFTVDRYIAICHPFHARTMFTLSRTMYIILAVSSIVTVYSLGMAYCGGKSGEFCDKYRFVFSAELYSVLFFLIPLVLNFVLYLLIGIKVFQSSRLFESINNKRSVKTGKNYPLRSLKMSVAVIAECCVCWAPMHVLSMMHKHYEPFKLNIKGDAGILLAYALYLLSTIINPIVYCVLSKTFRKSFTKALCSGGGIYQLLSTKFKKKESFELQETDTVSQT